MRTRTIAVTLLALPFLLALSCAKKLDSIEPHEIATSLQTFERGMEFLSQRNLRKAREHLSGIEYEPGSEDRARIEPLARLALADATFYEGTTIGYIDARGLYLDFVTLYGNHALAPYAQTQAGLASLEQVNHPTKDQSQTRQAIADFDEVIRRWPRSRFAIAAHGLRRVARSNLAEAEFLIGRFYLGRKAWPAAIDRFKEILSVYPDFTEIDKVRFHLGRALVSGGNRVEGELILDKLLTENPGSPWASPARQLLARSASSSTRSAEKSSDGKS
jgi:outer membrane protein assembly factor BamD